MIKYNIMKNIKDRLYIATFSKDAIEVAKANQLNIEINHTCISYLLDDENFQKTQDSIREDIRKSGSKQVIFHGPFTEIHPAAIDHRIVEAARKRLDEAYAMVKGLSYDRMVVHTGYVPFIYIKSWQVEKSVEFWQEYMKGKDSNFKIYIENVLEEEPYTLAEMMKQIKDPRIKLCLDVGHAHTMTKDVDIYAWIQVLGPYIGHFHLHSNYQDGDNHLPLGEGTIDFDKLFKVVEDNCNNEVTFTIESRECLQAVEWLEERGYI